jgi:hypothetical protein
MRESDGSVRMGCGSINAHRAVAVPAGKARPADLRPLHVRMRAAKDTGATWEQLADRFGFATAALAKAALERKERGAGGAG